MDDLFSQIRNCPNPYARFLVRASYLQIYNEQCSDLLEGMRDQQGMGSQGGQQGQTYQVTSYGGGPP